MKGLLFVEPGLYIRPDGSVKFKKHGDRYWVAWRRARGSTCGWKIATSGPSLGTTVAYLSWLEKGARGGLRL